MSKTVALIQARMSSTRFPNKVLQDLGGVPMLVHMVRRVRRAATLDEVVVVTSTDPSDEPLAAALAGYGVPAFRGDLQDVLSRYAAAAQEHAAEVVVRLTGDCPLADPAVIDRVVTARHDAQADYASNVDPPSYPDGFDVEVFTRAALERALREARLPSEREHVTLWMRTQGAGLSRVNCLALADFSSLRLTVDYPDDLAVVRAVVDECGADADLFDVLRCLSRRDDIRGINIHERNEGLLKSLAAEAHLDRGPSSGA